MKTHEASKMCLNKRRYPSMQEADKAIVVMKGNRSAVALVTLRAYECPVCGGTHISKIKTKQAENQKKRWMQGQNP